VPEAEIGSTTVAASTTSFQAAQASSIRSGPENSSRSASPTPAMPWPLRIQIRG
jgi:hypothetical protein